MKYLSVDQNNDRAYDDLRSDYCKVEDDLLRVRSENEELCSRIIELEARVRELEEGIRKHRELATNAINVCDCLGDKNLWALIGPTQEVRDE